MQVVVAAGNGYTAACEVSPGSSPSAITVGASDQFDRRWARSNWWVGAGQAVGLKGVFCMFGSAVPFLLSAKLKQKQLWQVHI